MFFLAFCSADRGVGRRVTRASEEWQRFVQRFRHPCRLGNAMDRGIRPKKDGPPGTVPPDDRLRQHSRSYVREAYTVAALLELYAVRRWAFCGGDRWRPEPKSSVGGAGKLTARPSNRYREVISRVV